MNYFNPYDLEALTVTRGIDDKLPINAIIVDKNTKVVKKVKNPNLINNFTNRMVLDDVGASFWILEKLWKENSWVRHISGVISKSCVNCNPLNQISSEINRGIKKKLDTYENILAYPNRNETGKQMYRKVYLSLALTGNAYLQIVKNRVGGIAGIYYIPPQSMRTIPFINEDTQQLEYAFIQLDSSGINVERVFFDDEIIHFKLDNPFNDTYGFAPLVALFKDLTFDFNGKNYINNWFDNTFSAGKIFKLPNSAKNQKERNMQEIREKFEGAKNAGKTLIVEGDMELLYDGNKIKDMDFSVLKDIGRDDIITAYGVPLSNAGVRSRSGNANAELIISEGKAFLVNTILGYQDVLYDTLDSKLFKQILKLPKVKLERGVNTQFDLATVSSAVKNLSTFCGTTINENRELVGKPPILVADGEKDWYNIPIIATNNGMLPLEQTFEAIENHVADGGTGIGGKVASIQPSLDASPDKGKVNIS